MRKLLLLLVLLFALTGCLTASKEHSIYLSKLDPLPTIESTEVLPLKVAVSAIISPQGTIESYQPLLDYMSANLNRPIEIVQRKTYAEINELVKNGEVDLAFICTSAYIRGHDDFGMKLIAAPQVNGKSIYHSILIVSAKSDIQSLEDLEGKVFAFTDPMSTTGWLYPTYLVQNSGKEPEEFFGRTIFTYSHDDAIEAVVNQIADGAAVDSLVYEFALRRNPELSEQIRIIHTSPSFGAPPVVTNPEVRPQFQAEIQSLLLNLHTTSEGQNILKALGFDQFVFVEDSVYDTIREIRLEVKQ